MILTHVDSTPAQVAVERIRQRFEAVEQFRLLVSHHREPF
jgi:hypothetical protein